MAIRFHCPKCHVRLSIAQRKAGHTLPCPNCRQKITIPADTPPPLPGKSQESKSADLEKRNEESLDAAPASSAEELANVAQGRSTSPQSENRGAPSGAIAVESWQSQTAIRELDPQLASPEYLASMNGTSIADHTITLPRWIVYFQAALLGIVATAFFFLGQSLNRNPNPSETGSAEMYDCQLTGKVVFARDGQTQPDEGAVVLLLPADTQLPERADTQGLRPDQFNSVGNHSIEQIEAVGGRIGRVNRNGEFDVTVRGPREYHVLIISNQTSRPVGEEIPSTAMSKVLGYFFATDLIGDNKYHLSTQVLNRRSQNLPLITF